MKLKGTWTKQANADVLALRLANKYYSRETDLLSKEMTIELTDIATITKLKARGFKGISEV